MSIVYYSEVEVVREQISGDRLGKALKYHLLANFMNAKQVSARSRVEIAKELMGRISKAGVPRRWYYVELYPRDPQEPQFRFVGKLLAEDEKEFVLEDQYGGLYTLRYAKS